MTHEEFEKKVMYKILDGKEEILHVLKKQYENAMVSSRQFTGCGFFTNFSVPDKLVDGKINGRINDLMAKLNMPNEEFYFILYITDGKIDTLEGFTTLDEWNQNYDLAQLEYFHQDRRELDIH